MGVDSGDYNEIENGILFSNAAAIGSGDLHPINDQVDLPKSSVYLKGDTGELWFKAGPLITDWINMAVKESQQDCVIDYRGVPELVFNRDGTVMHFRK
jgi:hypothetical protein